MEAGSQPKFVLHRSLSSVKFHTNYTCAKENDSNLESLTQIQKKYVISNAFCKKKEQLLDIGIRTIFKIYFFKKRAWLT